VPRIDPKGEEFPEIDCAQADFWSQRYLSGRTPWQLDYVPEQLAAFINALPAGAEILIPGSGGDWRTIRAFHEAGHYVKAIEFSPVAVEHARKALGKVADTLILANFFSYDFGPGRFDVIYERTFLCSLPRPLWENYVNRVAQLLRPKGKLAGFFLYGEETDPPPYPLTRTCAEKLFADRFELIRNETVADSLPIFRGMEKWQEWALIERPG
jgi:thiopurine S-methyltransferase